MDINRVSADELEAAKRRRCVDADARAGNRDVDAVPRAKKLCEDRLFPSRRDPAASETFRGSATEAFGSNRPVHRSDLPEDSSIDRVETAPVVGAEQCLSMRLPLPRTHERLYDAFVAVQQVGPLLRKRQRACTADVVCAAVETMTGRRCTLQMLRAVERIKPGTISFSLRGGSEYTFDSALPVSPRRVRADVAVAAPGAPRETVAAGARDSVDAKGASAAKFREALVAMVGGYHESFLRNHAEKVSETNASGTRDAVEDSKAPVVRDGALVEWHAEFDLNAVPDPSLAPEFDAPGTCPDARVVGTSRANARDPDEGIPETEAGVFLKRGAGARAAFDSRRLAGDSTSRLDDAAAYVDAALGESGAELPLAAVAAVMKRKKLNDHEQNPATISDRERRRLRDALPRTFDVVRSLFATSKKKVSPFRDLLDALVRANANAHAHGNAAHASRQEIEQCLRLLLEAGSEWCAAMSAETTVSGEELFRIKTSDAAVTRFVRQKLVAMKEDKL